AEVYDHPKTSFVARFVGNANILRGRVVSRRPGGAGKEILTFEHPAGRGGVAVSSGGPRDGEEIAVAVRSEYIDLEPAGAGFQPAADGSPGEFEGLEARITGKSFAAGQLRITAALRGGGEVTASRHGIDSQLEIGQTLRVGWPPDRAVPVDGGSSHA
ncbi:MAG: TOBE domain-containing protein, partial [Spirochaetaceae bacterium]|nr:TOBE domain-containing protein [Spirochaetaceae bacterium]